MVHEQSARLVRRALYHQHPGVLDAHRRGSEASNSGHYVLVPDPLIIAFAHDPLAVGVFAAVARLVMAAKTSVPLAARDLVAWMGSDRARDRTAVMRRIVKLEQAGWLLISRQTQHKHHLLPTWGRDQQGVIRPWNFAAPDTGRPAHLRGRRVPVELFDDYLGRLDPRPGQMRALISRYFTRPLLTLTDIGVYTIGLRAEVTPTPRLQHLGLHSEAGMLPPTAQRELLALAAFGQLTTIDDDTTVPVGLTIQGFARLGIAPPTERQTALAHEHLFGSPGESPAGSATGSATGSPPSPHQEARIPHRSATEAGDAGPKALIAWDVGMIGKSINRESPAHDPAGGGESSGSPSTAGSSTAKQPDSSLPPPAKNRSKPGGATGLARSIVDGHRALNPNRPISPGEWIELLALQQSIGTEPLLMWQSRAMRVRTQRPTGVTPGYYHACAARHACDTPSSPPATRPISAEMTAAAVSTPAQSQLDPARAALLSAMGVREQQALAGVPEELIRAWAEVIEHPGLAARFTSPVGFAVSQMRKGNHPPPLEELNRWAEQAGRASDRYESWRHFEPAQPEPVMESAEAELEARVRRLAPPGASLAELCELARLLEAGVPEEEAVASVCRTSAEGAL